MIIPLPINAIAPTPIFVNVFPKMTNRAIIPAASAIF